MNAPHRQKNPNAFPSRSWIKYTKRHLCTPIYGDLYHYAGNNPVRYVDPDGCYINLSYTNRGNYNYILTMVNKMSILQYKITDGKMEIDVGRINRYGSETFTRDMLYAFFSEFDISIMFGSHVPASIDSEIPEVCGGTCYFFKNAKKVFIILSVDNYPVIKTKDGKYSLSNRNEVFAHELSGHIVPEIKGINGNAVSIENEIRRQIGLDEREEEPDHASF